MDSLYYNLIHVAEAQTLSVKHNKSSEVIYCREQNFLFEKDLLLTPKKLRCEIKINLGSPVKNNKDIASLVYLSFKWENQIYH